MSDVEERLANIIVTQFAVDSDSITPATRFQEDLKVDTLGVARLLTAVESDFDIEIPNDKALLTVGDLLAYIKSELITCGRRPGKRRSGTDWVRRLGP